MDAEANSPAASPAVSLEVMRSLVRQVADRHKEVIQGFPQVAEIDEISALQDRLIDSCHKALRTLEDPRLSIAMMGTTSSGKSTLVNGLVGRRIAPVESAEMSAGVLQIRSGDNSVLRVSGEDGSGRRIEGDLTDQQAFDLIRSIMRTYHDRRTTETGLEAPFIKVVGSTVSAQDPTCLRLPQGIGLEFLDLPGLKSINDRENLEVIQTTIGKAFSLVALDYNQTDQEHRHALLAELQEIVEGMRGRTDLMAFVVNRIDTRSSDDIDIRERMQILAVEIQEALALPAPPPIFPLSGRLLYWVQCSWGSSPLDGQPSATPQETTDYLRNLLEECASDVFRMRRTSQENRELLNQIEASVHAGAPPHVDVHREFVRLARDASGGTALWELLATRLRQSFGEVVLLPAVHDVLRVRDEVAAALRTYAATHEEQTLARVMEESSRLEAEHRRISEAIQIRTADIKNRYAEADRLLQSDSYKDQLKAQDVLGPGMVNLSDTFNKVRSKLRSRLVRTLREAYAKRQPTYDLRDRLIRGDAVPADLAFRISESYDKFWVARHELKEPAHQVTNKSSGGGWTFKAQIGDKPATEALTALEQHLREVQIDGAEALGRAAEFFLQQQAAEILSAMKEVLSHQRDEVMSELRNSQVIKSIEEQLEVGAEVSLQPENLRLPEGLFTVSGGVKRDTAKQKKQTGTRTEKRKRGWWIFKWTEKYEVPVYKQVKYKTLTVPSDETFEAMWIDAVALNLQELQRILLEWVRGVLLKAHQRFQDETDAIVRMAGEMLARRRREIEGESDAARTDAEALRQSVAATTPPASQIRNLTGHAGLSQPASAGANHG